MSTPPTKIPRSAPAVVSLVVTMPSWAVSGPSSGSLLESTSIYHKEITVSGKFQDSEASFVCLCIASSL